ncbi:MGC83228 protein, related, partial [Eimeria acervulina]
EALASGSADETAKVWDLSTGSCLATYKFHENKVQAVLWHPSEASMLATASYDKTVRLIDVRQPNVAVSAEDGSLECIDFRKAATGPASAAAPSAAAAAAPRLWRIAAHSAAATALQQQQQLPGLLVSCGLDETAKVWDLRCIDSKTQGPVLLHEKDLKVGPLFSCRASEEKGVFGFGGSQVVIWDLGETEHIAKAFKL